MRTIALEDVREELLCRKTRGAIRGESKRDEIKAMGHASVSMPLPLNLLNRSKSRPLTHQPNPYSIKCHRAKSRGGRLQVRSNQSHDRSVRNHHAVVGGEAAQPCDIY